MIPPLRLAAILLVCLSAISCSKKWEEHNEVNNPVLTENLLSAINKNPDLSLFSQYLAKTGYDQLVASSKTFTIWAPTNEALAQLDPASIDTDDELKIFVGNHISNQTYLTSDIHSSLYIKTLNGKNVTFTKAAVDENPIISADNYVGNGVLHVINKAIEIKPNIYQYLLSTNTKQKNEIASLNFTSFDMTKAKQTGIDPSTGFPIYEPGTGILNLNRFTQKVPVNNEDSLYTYIILTDNAFDAEKLKLAKFYQTSRQDSTDSITNFNIIKDLAFKGMYDSNSFPDTVYSVGDSVKFHLDKNNIVSTKRVSNGIVYVMNAVNYKLVGSDGDRFTKIKPVIIQGEDPKGFMSVKAYSIRTKRNPSSIDPNRSFFKDILVESYNVANYWINYKAPVNSIKYKVYWRVVRDYSLTVPNATATDLQYYFPQRLAFGNTSNVAFTVAKPGVINKGIIDGVPTFAADYSEVYLGEYTASRLYSADIKSGLLNLFLIGNPTAASNISNSLLLDYIKLVPVP